MVDLPEWLSTAVVGAIIAALGYVAKLFIELWRSHRELHDIRRARLVELQSLLRATKVSFEIQVGHAERLLEMINTKYSDLLRGQRGYERKFSLAFEKFTEDEKELHGIIRGISVHSLKPTNQALMEWLRNDTYFKAQKNYRGDGGEFSTKLAALESHLILWHAKYESWIPNTPEHALVFLADEENHGAGFPKGLDELVAQVLTS